MQELLEHVFFRLPKATQPTHPVQKLTIMEELVGVLGMQIIHGIAVDGDIVHQHVPLVRNKYSGCINTFLHISISHYSSFVYN
jgi:hypothetical protein